MRRQEDEQALQKREKDEQDVRVDLFQSALPAPPPDEFADAEPDDDDREDFFPAPLDLQEAYGDDVEVDASAAMVTAEQANGIDGH